MALRPLFFSNHNLFAILLILLASTVVPVLCCYTSIISFGDSLADTGNLLYLEGDHPTAKGRFPYGMTYFHHPTGRCCDGRLVFDFIAQSLGLPFLPPYLVPTNHQNFRQGVDFAVAGATALDYNFYKSKNIVSPYANYSLTTQLEWFKEFMVPLCDPSLSSSDCTNIFNRSLIVMGEFGGNDYYYTATGGSGYEELRSIVPLVVNNISTGIQTLIKQGAKTFIVPGNYPLGCFAMYLSLFQSANEEFYDPKTGCLNWVNELVEYHNDLLQTDLDRLRKLHPDTTIIYADYYNSAMRFYRSPSQFGFSKGLTACCGGGGPYNYNSSATCGNMGSNVCDDPSLHISWDGAHLTEAAYKLIATSLLDGSYVIPPINISCSLVPMGDLGYVGLDPK